MASLKRQLQDLKRESNNQNCLLALYRDALILNKIPLPKALTKAEQEQRLNAEKERKMRSELEQLENDNQQMEMKLKTDFIRIAEQKQDIEELEALSKKLGYSNIS